MLVFVGFERLKVDMILSALSSNGSFRKRFLQGNGGKENLLRPSVSGSGRGMILTHGFALLSVLVGEVLRSEGSS